jgi:hypothetical protein
MAGIFSLKMRLSRVWHPVTDWEEMATPMWESGGDCDLEQAVEFTGDHKLYGAAMDRIIIEWPISCENALTNYNINRKAWVGHAAAALAIGSPQLLTRKAWSFLDDRQRALANREAARCIGLWERAYIKDRRLFENVDQPVLC